VTSAGSANARYAAIRQRTQRSVGERHVDRDPRSLLSRCQGQNEFDDLQLGPMALQSLGIYLPGQSKPQFSTVCHRPTRDHFVTG
jgi:hypothetical protein